MYNLRFSIVCLGIEVSSSSVVLQKGLSGANSSGEEWFPEGKEGAMSPDRSCAVACAVVTWRMFADANASLNSPLEKKRSSCMPQAKEHPKRVRMLWIWCNLCMRIYSALRTPSYMQCIHVTPSGYNTPTEALPALQPRRRISFDSKECSYRRRD